MKCIPAVGAARRAVEVYRELIGARVRFGTQRVQALSASSQSRLASAYTRVCGAETALRARAREIEAHARAERELSRLEQIQARLAIAQVVHECLDVVRVIADGSGSSVQFLEHELGRIQRDVQMLSTHTIFDLELATQQCGQAMLEAEGSPFARP